MNFITSCPLCGSQALIRERTAEDYITGSSHQLWKCNECGLVLVNPQPEAHEIGAYYPTTYYGNKPFFYEKLDAFFRTNSIKKLGLLPGKALDCGCGKGLLLIYLKKLGWDVHGTELSETSSEYGSKTLGIDIRNQDLDKCGFNESEFDLITMFHSFEHLQNPFKILMESYRILKPGGHLVIEIPRAEGSQWRVFRNDWFHLDIPRHLYHFCDATFENSLAKCHFNIIYRKKHDFMYDTFGIIQSSLNMMLKNFNLLNDINTKRKTFRSILSSNNKRLICETILSLAFQGVFYIPALFTAFILAKTNNGGTLSYVLEKGKSSSE